VIQGQFAVSGKIDILTWLQAFGFSERYQNDHLDKYHYFLHLITEKKVFNKAIGPEGFVSLNMKHLESFLGNPYAAQVRNNLLMWGIIQCDGSYSKGKYSLGYRIAPEYQGKAVLRNIHKTETMVAKLKKLQATYQDKTGKDSQLKNLKLVGIRHAQALTYIDAKLEATLTFIDAQDGILSSFDKDSGMDNEWYSTFLSTSSLLANIYPLMFDELVKKGFQAKENEGLTAYDLLTNYVTEQYNRDFVAILKIANGDYFYKQPDPSSRVFTNVSNLSTDLRQFLIHRKDKTRLVNLDIRNSQPYLLSLLLTDKYAGIDLPEDVKHYIQLTSTGTFYEYMMNHLGTEAGKRRAFKIKFFASLFFCQNHHAARTTAGKAFKNIFPNVYTLIHELKADDYRQLAITMQRREASVILGVIGKQLLKENMWFVTIHDSVVVTQDNVEAVKNIITEAFLAAVGVAPTIETDVLVEAKNQQVGNGEIEEEEAQVLGSIYELEGWEEEKAQEIGRVEIMVKSLVEEATQGQTSSSTARGLITERNMEIGSRNYQQAA
jgi:hypothetical protein